MELLQQLATPDRFFGFSKRSALVHVILGRFLILGGLFIVVSTGSLSVAGPAFYVFGMLAFVVTLPYLVFLRKRRGLEKVAGLQFILDVIITGGLVHYTGGLESDLFILYPLIILAAGIVQSGWFAVRITLLSIFCYATIVAMEASGLLVYRGEAPDPYLAPAAVAQALMLRIFILVFYSAASAYLADLCSNQKRQLNRYALLVETVFDHMPDGLLAVDDQGSILLANRAILDHLQMKRSGLIGHQLQSIFQGPTPASEGTSSRDEWRLLRPDGQTVPVICHMSRTVLPNLLLAEGQGQFGSASDDPDQSVQILALRDISPELEAERANQELAGLRMTLRVVTELAHHVRNSVVAIQGASQLVNRIVQEMDNTRTREQNDKTDAEAMCRIVEKEITSLEAKITGFLNSANETPESVIKDADEAYQKYFTATNSESSTAGAAPPRH